jgi:antitoxin ParD1/3/4
MAGRNFSLTPRPSDFADHQVGAGRHQNASEVVREALRRCETALREDDPRIAAIRSAIEQGRSDMARGTCTIVATAEDEAQLFSALTSRSPAQRAAAE